MRSCASQTSLLAPRPELALQQVAAGDHPGRRGARRGGLAATAIVHAGHGPPSAGSGRPQFGHVGDRAVRLREFMRRGVSLPWGEVPHPRCGKSSPPVRMVCALTIGEGSAHGRPLPSLPALRGPQHRAGLRRGGQLSNAFAPPPRGPRPHRRARRRPRPRSRGQERQRQRPPSDRPARHRPRRLAGRLRDGRPRLHARRRVAPRDRRPPDRGRHHATRPSTALAARLQLALWATPRVS